MLQLNNKNGLSIIEVLVATGIMAILMAGFSSMMLSQNKETRAVAEILSAQDLMKSMIASLAKGDVCHHILSTRNFNAAQVVAGNPFTINIGTQPIYSSMVASGTPGPVLIKKGDKASAYTSSLEIESIQFEVTTGIIAGSIGNFQGRWIVNFDGSKSVRKLRPLSISAVITANTTVPAMANTISCLGSGGSMGSGDQNFLTKWVTDTEIKESVIYEDPANGRIGIGTTTPSSQLAVSGVLTSGKLQIIDVVTKNAACTPNGLVGRDSDGLLLSCQSGTWKQQFRPTMIITNVDEPNNTGGVSPYALCALEPGKSAGEYNWSISCGNRACKIRGFSGGIVTEYSCTSPLCAIDLMCF